MAGHAIDAPWRSGGQVSLGTVWEVQIRALEARQQARERQLAVRSGSAAGQRTGVRVADFLRREKVALVQALARDLSALHELRVRTVLRARVPLVTVEPARNEQWLSFDLSAQPRKNFGRFTVLAMQAFGAADPRVRQVSSHPRAHVQLVRFGLVSLG